MTSVAGASLLSEGSSRVEGVRFDLLDASGNVIGEVHPGYGCSIKNSTKGVLKRSLNGFVLDPSERNDVNIASDRVRPMWLLPATGDELPCGVFLWAGAQQLVRSFGIFTPGQLLDFGVILGQPIQQTVSLSIGDSVRDKIVEVAALAGFPTISIEASDATVSAPTAFPVGGANTYAKVLSELAGQGGYYDHYFSNAGLLTFRRVIDPNGVTASFTLDPRLIDDTITLENDLLGAANRYVCVDTANRTSAIVGIYDLPSSSPNSITSRTFAIPKFIDAPGIGTEAAAVERATAAAQQDVRAYETLKAKTIADPRHDTFDVVSYGGANYIELEWGLRLAPSGSMDHVIKRVYA